MNELVLVVAVAISVGEAFRFGATRDGLTRADAVSVMVVPERKRCNRSVVWCAVERVGDAVLIAILGLFEIGLGDEWRRLAAAYCGQRAHKHEDSEHRRHGKTPTVGSDSISM